MSQLSSKLRKFSRELGQAQGPPELGKFSQELVQELEQFPRALEQVPGDFTKELSQFLRELAHF